MKLAKNDVLPQGFQISSLRGYHKQVYMLRPSVLPMSSSPGDIPACLLVCNRLGYSSFICRVSSPNKKLNDLFDLILIRR